MLNNGEASVYFKLMQAIEVNMQPLKRIGYVVTPANDRPISDELGRHQTHPAIPNCCIYIVDVVNTFHLSSVEH
jgi:hypothetical protein